MKKAQMTYTQWKIRYSAARDRADRISKMILDRARDAAARAGLDPSIMGVHVHNALVSRSYGNPWPGVDYRLARLAKHLMEKAFEPRRIVDRWSDTIEIVWPGDSA